MRRLFGCFVFFLAALLPGQSVWAAQQVIIYADEDYPPYSYVQEGTVKGIYAEIFSAAFSKMRDYDVQVIGVPWKRGLKLMEEGRGFALFPPYKRLVERPYIFPYSIPVLKEEVVIVCRKGILPQFNRATLWPDDYRGLSITKNLGFANIDKESWQNAQKQGVILETGKGNETNLLKLIKGRVSCYVNDRLSIHYGLEVLRNQNLYQPAIHGEIEVRTVISWEWGYMGFSNTSSVSYPFKNDFILQLNRLLEEMKESGEIERIAGEFLRY